MKFSLASIAVTSTLTVLTHAHGLVDSLSVNGKTMPGWDKWKKPVTAAWHADNGDNGFVSSKDINKPDIICHKAATNGEEYLNVKAGETIKLHWNQWPDSHRGPIISYIAPCSDCIKVDKKTLLWTKIEHQGYAGGVWITDKFLKNGKISNATIPAALQAGNYVLRHEMIALHGAQNGDAQFYPQCINIKVSGSGTAAPTGGVSGMKIYAQKEAGLNFNLYQKQITSYPIPGPALWKPK